LKEARYVANALFTSCANKETMFSIGYFAGSCIDSAEQQRFLSLFLSGNQAALANASMSSHTIIASRSLSR
jgi:hypothetical protein